MRIALMLAVASVMLGSTSSLAAEGDKPAPSVEVQLLELDTASGMAQKKRDIKALSDLVADEIFYSGADGALLTKSQLLEMIRSGDRILDRYEATDTKIQLHPTFAVITGKLFTDGVARGVGFAGNFRYSKVFVKRGGGWKIISWTVTGIRAP